MNLIELALILGIALLVFGPKKLPTLARHLGLLMRKVNQIHLQLSGFWHRQQKALQLEENERQAKKADRVYEENKAD